MPKKINPQTLTRAVQSSRTATEAARLTKAADDVERVARKEAREKAFRIRWWIARGRTTGDHLLDINATLFESLEQDETYRSLEAFEQLLKEHAGELVVDTRSFRDTLGVVHEQPLLTCSLPEAYGDPRDMRLHFGTREAKLVFMPLQAAIKGGVLADEQFYFEMSSFERGQVPKTLLFGNEIQPWFEKLHRSRAFDFLVASRMLGQPLEVFPALGEYIQECREELTLELSDLMADVRAKAKELRDQQSDPAKAAEACDRRNSRITADGLELVLPAVAKYHTACNKLAVVIEKSKLYEMYNSSTFCAAVRCLAEHPADELAC